MRKRHKRIRNGVVVLTVLAVGGLFVYGQKVKEITKEIEYKINVEQVSVDAKQEKVIQLEAELENMDSLEYVRKIADKELKMVEKDTIVFRAKE